MDRVKVVVCGLGYVGAATAACLLKDGHSVAGVDVNPARNQTFASGRSSVYERGVDELLSAGKADGRLLCGACIAEHAGDADVVLVCVGTPAGQDGKPDLSQILAATAEIGAALKERPSRAAAVTIAYRSTMLPGSMETTVAPALIERAGPPGERYEVVYNPEFMREGTAIRDYFAPPRIVVGERVPGRSGRLKELYSGIDAPVFEVPMAVAEMTKYADNAFHALKVAFVNDLARLASALNISAQSVSDIFVADTKLNVSQAYLRPGGAFGGSCLPKDVRALTACLRENDVKAPVIENILSSNVAHKDYLAEHVASRAPCGGRILLLGLTFKPGTDDLRESPLVDLAENLLERNFHLAIHEPDLRERQLAGVNLDLASSRLRRLLELLTDDVENEIESADLIVIGKSMPGLSARLAGDARALDVNRL